jgi:hypothetical protein
MTQYLGDCRCGGGWKQGASLRKRWARETDSSMVALCSMEAGGTTVLGSWHTLVMGWYTYLPE